jgi:hypothetical protein
MKHEKKVYLRKKDKRYVFETKIQNNSIHLITLPTNYYKFLKEMCRLIKDLSQHPEIMPKSSFFSKDKWSEIAEKLESADTRVCKSEKECL